VRPFAIYEIQPPQRRRRRQNNNDNSYDSSYDNQNAMMAET
jgi:hypothetical protein